MRVWGLSIRLYSFFATGPHVKQGALCPCKSVERRIVAAAWRPEVAVPAKDVKPVRIFGNTSVSPMQT